MNSHWDDAAQDDWRDDLDEAVYGTRAIGGHADLVLHGGGNSSLKSTIVDVTGERLDVIYVKGSGWDMGSIERPGFAPLRLERVRQLLEVEHISDPVLVNELKCAAVDASAPDASIEAPMHAMLPHRAVLHSHADAIVALTDQPDGAARARQVFGADIVVVPYVKPGFSLAKAVAEAWATQATASTRGMVLLKHGLFTFGESMREAYDTHLSMLDLAQAALSWSPVEPDAVEGTLERAERDALVVLRAAVSRAAGRPMIAVRTTNRKTEAFLGDGALVTATQRGTATPDHVIRTKPHPLIGRDVPEFVADYAAYFERNRHRDEGLTMLDPAPRYALDRDLGLVSFGKTPKEALAVRDIAEHTMDVVAAAEANGAYEPVAEGELFDVEYWDLEQAKLRRAGAPAVLAGQVAIVTGAASGIGRACAARLLSNGAAVVGVDLSSSVVETFASPAYAGVVADATDPDAVTRAIDTAAARFGGLDIVIVAAGIFPESAPIATQTRESWDKTIAVNATAVRELFAQAHPVLKASPIPARVVLIASKNVAAPGPGAAAYSASKAAVTQLARVAALEWAPDGIHVNVIHPDAVFDTALWTPELLAERAAKYGMSVDAYKRRNLLGVEVNTGIVADMAVTMCGDAFLATTGAQVPVDGGNERVV